MALANLNTADFIKGSGVSQLDRIIEITGGGGGSITVGDKQILYSDGANNPVGDATFTFNKTTKVIGLESIDFDTTPTATDAEGRLLYSADEGTLVYTVKGGNISTPINGALLALVNNGEATTLNKGEVVYAYSAQGERVQVKRASNASESTSSKTFGIVAESIASGAEGFVMVHGIVRGIDTSAYSAGTSLYLGTSGAFTSTKPSAPNHLVYVGFVVKVNASSGEVFAKIQNGYELDEIHDVAISGLANGDLLAYESSTSLWKNKTKSALSIQNAISLTTTNSSGSATFIGDTLNIPTYTLAGLGGFANPMTTLGDVIYGGASGVATRLSGNTTTAKQYLSQTGSGSASAAPIWATIAGADVTGAALTKTDDTNVTLTLGGTPTTALLRAASLTLGWTGQLATSRGGTGLSTIGTANQLLRVNSGATGLEYFTPTYLNAAITTLNTLTASTQTFAVGTSGTDFAISSATSTHTFNLPTASAANRGALSSTDWSTFNNKQATITLTTTGSSGAATFVTNTLNIPNYTLAGLGGFANPMTTLGDIIYGGASGAATRLAGNTTTAKQYLSQTGTGTISAIPAWATITGSDITGAALTKVDDTNVTITLGGTPSTALLRAASITVGWTGQLAIARGGTGLSALGTANQLLRVNAGATALEYFTPTYLTAAITSLNALTAATQTFANDTNVTITSVTSTHTLGWSGQLAVSRGGTGASTLTGVLIGNGTSAVTAVTGTASQLLRRNAGDTAYEFFTFTGLSNPMTTLGDIIYGAASGVATRLAGNITTAKQFLSQTGTGTVSAIPAWATITGADITGAALTKTDDTNVTLTLGGTPATSLIRAASLTLGWTGTLAVSRGGLGVGTITGVLIGNGTSAVTAVAGTASQLLRRNAGNTAYEFFTPTFASAGSGNELQKSDGAGGFLGTDIFTATSSGTLTIGSTAANLTRSITVENSTTDASLFLLAKGAGSVIIGSALYTQGFITRTSSVVSMIVQTANTNIVIPALSLEVQTSGTPAIGIGTGLNFSTETAANVYKTGSSIESVSTNVTTATEAFDLVFKTMSGGAAATEKVRITSGGNVGIGTSSPDANQLVTINGDLRLSGSARKIVFGTAGVASDYLMLQDVVSGSALLSLVQDGSEKFRIDGVTGNVGIGTSTIGSIGTGYKNVDIRGTNGGGLIFGVPGTVAAYVFGASTSLYLESIGATIFTAGGSERVRILSTGNIGINEASPSARFEVKGTGTTTGALVIFKDSASAEKFKILDDGTAQFNGTFNVSGNSIVTGLTSLGTSTLASGTTAMGFGTYNVVKVIPNATATYTSTVPRFGTICQLVVTTSGTSSYTITFGTGFKTTGTLTTGVNSGRNFILEFVSDGTSLIESSRTVAIA